MERTTEDVLVDTGRWLLESRHRRGLRQVDLSELSGVSTSTLSRMELGHGGSVPLRTWLRAFEAMGAELVRRPATRGGVLLAGLPALLEPGGWQEVWRGDDIVWFDRPARWITDLRTERAPAERLVVSLVVTVTDPANAWDRLVRAKREARSAAPSGVVTGGVLVVPRTSENRLRARGRLPTILGGAWVGAARSPRARMPLRPGLVWLTPDGTRLRGGW
jgi:transcriptional regulator with XRE-family HTH domain